jgi:hypothetical protein
MGTSYQQQGRLVFDGNACIRGYALFVGTIGCEVSATISDLLSYIPVPLFPTFIHLSISVKR